MYIIFFFFEEKSYTLLDKKVWDFFTFPFFPKNKNNKKWNKIFFYSLILIWKKLKAPDETDKNLVKNLFYIQVQSSWPNLLFA